MWWYDRRWPALERHRTSGLAESTAGTRLTLVNSLVFMISRFQGCFQLIVKFLQFPTSRRVVCIECIPTNGPFAPIASRRRPSPQVSPECDYPQHVCNPKIILRNKILRY